MNLRHLAIVLSTAGTAIFGFGLGQLSRGHANGWSMFITLGVMIDVAVIGTSMVLHYRKYGRL